jgi:hypothetical protein
VSAQHERATAPPGPSILDRSGDPPRGTPADWLEFQRRAKRGFTWRIGFFALLIAGILWLSLSLNAMRLYTITSAPSYVPMSVERYWIATGFVGGATLVLVVETIAWAKRLADERSRTFPLRSRPGPWSPNRNSPPPPDLAPPTH